MFVIEIDDRTLLDDLANFLEFKLPGVATREDDHLVVSLDGAFSPRTQKRILKRLVWAWRVERQADAPIPVLLTHVERTHV